MKNARVLEVRDLTPAPIDGDGPDIKDRIEALLLRYPEIDQAEEEEILRFLKKGSHLDVGLLCARDRVKPKVEAFRRAHAKRFALGLKDVLLFLAIAAAPILGMAWYFTR
jgi:hypothetical protein